MSAVTMPNLKKCLSTGKEHLSNFFVKNFPDQAIKISNWAKENPQQAKITAIASAILGCYFFVTAVKLALPSISLVLSIAALSVAVLCFNQIFNK